LASHAERDVPLALIPRIADRDRPGSLVRRRLPIFRNANLRAIKSDVALLSARLDAMFSLPRGLSGVLETRADPGLRGRPRHCRGCGLGRECRKNIGDDHIDRTADQFGHQRRQPVDLIVGIASFDCDVFAFALPSGPGGTQPRSASKRQVMCSAEARSPASPVAARAPSAATRPPRRRAA
jgi:hypothetical protein